MLQRIIGASVSAFARATFIATRSVPLVDLLVRAWLGQVFWMTGLAGLLDWRAALTQTPGLVDALSMHPQQAAVLLTGARLVLPPLLLVGFATRLAALPLLIISLAAYSANP